MISFALLGLGLGAIYAMASSGLILIYRGAGIINFAQGAFAVIGAYAYFELAVRQDLPTVVALSGALVVSALAGALVYGVVMRPLRHVTALGRVIATLGLMTLIQQIFNLRYESLVRTVPSILPTRRVELFEGATVGLDKLLLLGLAAVISLALWAIYRFTLFGLATTAVAENEVTAQLAGHSPDRIALVNWMAGATLGGAAGVFIAPISGLSVDVLVLLIVPALAAGLLGGFASFPAALGASVAMGIAQALMARYITVPGWADAVPFLVVILVLVVRGRGLPLRSHLNERLPSIGTGHIPRMAVAAASGVGVLLIWTMSVRWLDALISTFIVGIIALSLIVLTGYAGQLSLAQFALAGIAGFVSTRLNATLGVPFELGFVLGVAAAVVAGLLVGIPALRTRGINLAIVTFGLAFAIQSILFQNNTYTGGVLGTVVDPPTVFGWEVESLRHPDRYALVCLVALVLCALVTANVRRGRSGRRLVAVRSNERAAAALGISVYGAKFYAFALSAGLAGVGGVLLAYRHTFVVYSEFDVFASIEALILVVITGIGYIPGAVMAGGGALGGLWPELLANVIESGKVHQYVAIALSLGLILALAHYPNGIAGEIVERLGARRRRRAPEERPAGLAPEQSSPDEVDEVGVERTRAAAAGVPVRDRVRPRELTIESISVRFGVVQAVDGVSLTVRSGEVLGVMGPNGAGKTTLIDAVTGFVEHQGGRVLLDGKPINGLSPGRRARLGVARSFQSLELFEEISVYDNLLTASDRWSRTAYVTDLVRPGRAVFDEATRAAIDVLGLSETLHRKPTELPFGQRRLVAIARAMASSPSVLLLDEPAAGLDEHESEELGRLIRLLADEWGFAIFLVDHDVPMMMATCDRMVALDFGRVIAEGTPEDLRNDPVVIEAYLGTTDGSADGEQEMTPVKGADR